MRARTHVHANAGQPEPSVRRASRACCAPASAGGHPRVFPAVERDTTEDKERVSKRDGERRTIKKDSMNKQQLEMHSPGHTPCHPQHKRAKKSRVEAECVTHTQSPSRPCSTQRERHNAQQTIQVNVQKTNIETHGQPLATPEQERGRERKRDREGMSERPKMKNINVQDNPV